MVGSPGTAHMAQLELSGRRVGIHKEKEERTVLGFKTSVWFGALVWDCMVYVGCVGGSGHTVLSTQHRHQVERLCRKRSNELAIQISWLLV